MWNCLKRLVKNWFSEGIEVSTVLGSVIGYSLVALVSTATGLIEARRILLFVAKNKIVFHPLYLKEIRRVEEQDGQAKMQLYVKELTDNWWRHQGRDSLFVSITTVFAGLLVMFLLFT